MSGMGYIVSWDVAAWIAATEQPTKIHDGPEDKVFEQWLRWGRKGKNVCTARRRRCTITWAWRRGRRRPASGTRSRRTPSPSTSSRTTSSTHLLQRHLARGRGVKLSKLM
ncbi:hypothetical protein ABZP36_032211 [Zizania latifolia]